MKKFAVTLVLAVLVPTLAFGWTKSLDFEGGTLGDKVGLGSTTAKYSNDQAYTGSQSALTTIKAGATAFGSWGGIVSHPSDLHEGDDIWVRLATFWPNGSTYNADPRLKFLRVHTRNAATSNFGYDDWYINKAGSNPPFQFIYEGEQTWTKFGSSGDQIVKGRWEVYEMYLKLHHVSVDGGGLARVRVWKDGRLMADITERKTLKTADAYANATYFFTYWNGGAPAASSCYMDDIVVTSDTPTMRDAKGNPMVGPKPGARIEVSQVYTSAPRPQLGARGFFDIAGRRVARGKTPYTVIRSLSNSSNRLAILK